MESLDADTARARLNALSELEKRLSFRISRLSKLVDSDATRQLAGSPLNLTAYRILMVLSIFDETSAADLARLMVIDRAQVSRSVAQMIDQGFLDDRPDPTSKRRRLLRLSDAGRAEFDRVAPRFAERQDIFQTLLSADELSALTRAIDTLSRYLAQEVEQPDAMPTDTAPHT